MVKFLLHMLRVFEVCKMMREEVNCAWSYFEFGACHVTFEEYVV